jgi:hypothetical protein
MMHKKKQVVMPKGGFNSLSSKGTIEMQNDDRFKGLMELMLPGMQQIWNALYDLPTNIQVTYEDTLSHVIYDSASKSSLQQHHPPLTIVLLFSCWLVG